LLCCGALQAADAPVPADSIASIEVRALRAGLARIERRLTAAIDGHAHTLRLRLDADSALLARIPLRQREEARHTEAAITDLRNALARAGSETREAAGDLSHRLTRQSAAATTGIAVACALSLCALLPVFTRTARPSRRPSRPRVRAAPVNQPAAGPAEPDHALAVAVAREVFRVRSRGENPDAASKALRRLEDELASRGYAARDLTGLPYRDGMAARVSEINVDPAMPPGSACIRRTLRPEIACKGRILEPATVEVSVAPADQSTGLRAESPPPIIRRIP
jgi:hypothetical protein